MQKRVGIISLYHKNRNYGGLLQAFALQRVIESIENCTASQITYDAKGENRVLCRWNNKRKLRKTRIKSEGIFFLFKGIKSKYYRVVDRIMFRNKQESIRLLLQKRIDRMEEFEKTISHTEVVDKNSISQKLNPLFDVFITGSDQVWNPDLLYPAYFLDFTEKKKVSYAASIGKSVLYDNEKEYFQKQLKGFQAISVREKTAATILNGVIIDNKKVEVVLDPTLLMRRSDWDEVIEDYKIEGDYLLTYFLGTSKKQRREAIKYATKNNLKIISFPHIIGHYRSVDDSFGDYQVYDATPLQFISLIKNATCVFTDSFHACLFSIVYNVKFRIFDREDYGRSLEMSSRIYDLLSLFELSDQLKKEYLILPEFKNEAKYEELRTKSMDYLKRSILGT